MAHTVYDNFVLENKIDDILTTAVDLSNYMTIDTSLTQEPGMTKTVHTYTPSGDVEDLAQGAGNSGDITVSFTSKDYVVKVTQGRFQYFDEQEMKDPMVVDTGLEGLAKSMILPLRQLLNMVKQPLLLILLLGLLRLSLMQLAR